MDTNHTNGKHDVWTHRILVAGLAGCSILNIAFIGYLAAVGTDVPHALSALAFTTIGALVGMLTTIMKGNGQ
jgi:hypothetical protein